MEVVQYKCPNCSANLEFQAEGGNFVCKFCDSVFTTEQLAEIFPEKEAHKLDKSEPVKTAEELELEEQFGQYNCLYNCPSCGAGVVTDENTSATKCVYCLSPVILTGRLSGEYKPSKLIPFKVTKAVAESKFKEYCKKRWFLPSDFRSGAKLHEMTAIYVPYWMYDCSAAGALVANCKKTRSWTTGNHRHTEHKEYVVVRDGSMQFTRIPHDASTRANDVMMECIEPFNYADTSDFKMSYLSGYIAEKYDVEKHDVKPRLKERAVTTATDIMRTSIQGYSSVNITNNNIDVGSEVWNHYLLPVWFLTYKYKDTFYHFAVNGQTGKFAGDLPFVKKKVFLSALGISLLVNAVTFALAWFL